MATAADTVKAKIAGKKVMVFSKAYCPFCKMAKDVLKGYNLGADEYEVWEIENEPNCSEIQSVLKELTGAQTYKDWNRLPTNITECPDIEAFKAALHATVPRVFINGHCIGGGSETKAQHASGELRTKLK